MKSPDQQLLMSRISSAHKQVHAQNWSHHTRVSRKQRAENNNCRAENPSSLLTESLKSEYNQKIQWLPSRNLNRFISSSHYLASRNLSGFVSSSHYLASSNRKQNPDKRTKIRLKQNNLLRIKISKTICSEQETSPGEQWAGEQQSTGSDWAGRWRELWAAELARGEASAVWLARTRTLAQQQQCCMNQKISYRHT